VPGVHGWGVLGRRSTPCDETDPGVVVSGASPWAPARSGFPGCIRDGRPGSTCCTRPRRASRPVSRPASVGSARSRRGGRPPPSVWEETLSCTLIASARADMRNETLHRSPPPALIRGPSAGHGKADGKRYLRQGRGNRCCSGKDRSERDANPSMMVVIGFLGSHV
jgi:hypothetical protein